MRIRIQNVLRFTTRLWPVLSLSLALCAAQDAQADVLAAWEVVGVDLDDVNHGIDAPGAPYTFTAGTLLANVADAKLTLGAGVNPSTAADQYGFKISSAQSSLADAITENHYIEITIDAAAGHVLNLSSLTFNGESTGTGADNLAILTSVDPFVDGNETYSASSLQSTTYAPSIDLTDAKFQGTSTITLRIYGWNTSGSTGVTRIRNTGGNDLVVSGTVTAAGPVAPSDFTATAASDQQINLSWAENVNLDDVLVAWNTSDTFSDPVDETSYSEDGLLPGGNGTVLYNGDAEGFNHTGLDANVTYYYKAWSVDGDTNYSAGVTVNATTDNLPAPTASAASATNVTAFTAAWGTVSGADGYELDVSTNAAFGRYAIEEDFTDGDFTSSPVWSGDTNGYVILTDATLPNGNASTDGSFLGSVASTNYVILTTPSTEVNEWRFSLGSTDFNPSSLNHFGVILMSDTAVTNKITDAIFQGYYIRLSGDLELWRSTGSGKVEVGAFSGAGNFVTGALRDGLDLRVTRNASGEFELFYAEGFTYASAPSVSAGVLTNTQYNSSSFFGVYGQFNNASADRRVYIDNIVLGTDEPDFLNGYQSRGVAGGATISASVTGLVSNTEYFYRVRATNDTSTSANSAMQSVTTLVMPAPVVQAAGNIGGDRFDANWSAVPEAGGYFLDVSTNSAFGVFQDGYEDRDVGDVSTHTVTGLVPEVTYHYRVRAYDAGSTSGNSATQTVATVLKAEPSNHATDFTAAVTTHRTIVLEWTDAVGLDLPDAYIVRGSTNGYADIPAPVDSNTVGNVYTWNPRYARRVEYGEARDEVSGQNSYGLIPGQTYYFKLFPVANSDAFSNYKTNGTVPQLSVTMLTDVPFEDFESGVGLGGKTAYETGDVTTKSGVWALSEVLLLSSDKDRKRDQRALRMRNLGAATMKFDVTDVETMTLEHANYGTDTGGKFVVEWSVNGSDPWNQIGTEVTCGDTLQTAAFTVHRLAAFRLRIRKTADDDDENRINIDNIRFTPYEHEGSVFRFR